MQDSLSSKGNSKFSRQVVRSFIAKNVGNLPLKIEKMSIKNQGCEAYGFRVMNCEGFELLPEQEREILISYYPDPSLNYFVREFFIYTNEGLLRFDLEVQMPSRKFRESMAVFYNARSEYLTGLFTMASCALAVSFIYVYLQPLAFSQKNGQTRTQRIIRALNFWSDVVLPQDILALEERNHLLQEELNNINLKGRKRKGRTQDFKEELESLSQPKYKSTSWADWAEDRNNPPRSKGKPESEVSSDKVFKSFHSRRFSK